MRDLELLILPVIALMCMAFLINAALRATQDATLRQILIGGVFGAMVLLGMTIPFDLGDGVIFDLRGLLVSTAVVFGGWLAGLVAMLAGGAYRIYLGGTGTIPGLVTLGASFLVGLVWLRLVARRWRFGPVQDAALGLCSLLGMVGVLFLPEAMQQKVVADLMPALPLTYVAGAMAIGFMYRRELTHHQIGEEVRRIATTDPLTRLLNRNGTQTELMRQTAQGGAGRAVLYFDVDRFKSINDCYGHDVGDQALAEVARRVRGAIREDDAIISRHCGDEFTIYLPDIGPEAVEGIARRLGRIVSKAPLVVDGKMIDLSVCIGGYWTAEPLTYDRMLSCADKALLKAKSNGSNSVVVDRARPAVAAAS